MSTRKPVGMFSGAIALILCEDGIETTGLPQLRYDIYDTMSYFNVRSKVKS